MIELGVKGTINVTLVTNGECSHWVQNWLAWNIEDEECKHLVNLEELLESAHGFAAIGELVLNEQVVAGQANLGKVNQQLLEHWTTEWGSSGGSSECLSDIIWDREATGGNADNALHTLGVEIDGNYVRCLPNLALLASGNPVCELAEAELRESR